MHSHMQHYLFIFSCTFGPIFVQLMFYIPTQKCFFWSPCTCASTVPAEFPPGFQIVENCSQNSLGTKWRCKVTQIPWITLLTLHAYMLGHSWGHSSHHHCWSSTRNWLSYFFCSGGKSSHTESCPKVEKIIFKSILAKSFKVFIICMG